MKIIFTVSFLSIFIFSGCTTTQVIKEPDKGLFEINGAANISYTAPKTTTTVYDEKGSIKQVIEQAQIATTTTYKADGTKVVEEKPMTVNMFIKDVTPKIIPETPLQTCVNGLIGISKLGVLYGGIVATRDIAMKPSPAPQVVQVQPVIVRPEIVTVPE